MSQDVQRWRTAWLQLLCGASGSRRRYLKNRARVRLQVEPDVTNPQHPIRCPERALE